MFRILRKIKSYLASKRNFRLTQAKLSDFTKIELTEKENIIVVCNFTPVVRTNYRIGLTTKGKLTEIFNSDKVEYGGSGVTNSKSIKIDKTPWNWKDYSAEIVLPPLGVTVFKIS